MPASAPSQIVIDIEEVRDGVIVMKDHSLRALLMTSSLNFALKSQDEQTAISMQYQSFLNSLDFPVQFFILSRKLDIAPYLETLKEAEKKQTSDLLKVQITEYVEFIKTFVQASSIMSKSFYIVVPFNSPSAAEASGISKLFSFGRSKAPKTLDPATFEEYKTQLWQRVDQVVGGIMRAGIRAAPLNTEELIELFYGLYNPGESDRGKPPISS